MVMNKRGFLRIIEATVAIMIVLGALLLITLQQKTPDRTVDLAELLPPYLDELAENPATREDILSYEITKPFNKDENKVIIENLEEYIKNRVNNPTFDLTVRICDAKILCVLEPYPVSDPTNIFAAERVVSTNLDGGDVVEPRKVKVFIWKRQTSQ